MIGLYAAYSQKKGGAVFQETHPSSVRTAHQAKKLMGLDKSAWLYIRLPRHAYDPKCCCHHCDKFKSGIFERPVWVGRNEKWNPATYPYVRTDIRGRNARLNLAGGSLLVGVDLHYMDRWAEELYENAGRFGLVWAAEWIMSEDRKKLCENQEAS